MLKINKKTLAIAISAVVVATGASTIQAAGFQLKEQSAEGQGNSFAGQTAKAVDASTIFYNPAGMSRLEGNHVQSNLSYIAPKAKYEHSSASSIVGASPLSKSSGIDGGVSAIVPAAYAVWDYSDDIKLGISINAPYGLSTKFDEDWVGADYNVLSEIKTINIAPSISYKVNDKFSIGGNIQFQKLEGTLSSQTFYKAGLGDVTVKALTTLKAEDTGFGYSLGFLYEYSDKGRIGFNYRSEIKHTLKGEVSTPDIGSKFDATAKFTTPAAASIGIYHDVSDQWALLADVSWTDWSVFDELEVLKTDGSVATSTTYNWSDNVFVALGANYQYDEKLQLKFGVAYDQGAANDEDRTAGIPDATRYWASIGASYKVNKQTTLNAGFSHIRAKSAKVTEAFSTTNKKATSYSGTFKPSVNILSVGMDYQF
ncbi:MAG: outer membrane protein transport protein [Oceanospirillaceae bacterium]|nr:outer membrane protein transport protein [Oceanospirillaceae bacterium]